MMSQINSAEYLQTNRTIDSIIESNCQDGTIRLPETGEISHELRQNGMYDVYLIDRLGFPNMIGTYVFEKMDGDQYVLKRVDWIIGINYNMLLLPVMLADRYMFGSREHVKNDIKAVD